MKSFYMDNDGTKTVEFNPETMCFDGQTTEVVKQWRVSACRCRMWYKVFNAKGDRIATISIPL